MCLLYPNKKIPTKFAALKRLKIKNWSKRTERKAQRQKHNSSPNK